MAKKRKTSRAAGTKLTGGAAKRGKRASVGPRGVVNRMGEQSLAKRGRGQVRNTQRKAKARKR